MNLTFWRHMLLFFKLYLAFFHSRHATTTTRRYLLYCFKSKCVLNCNHILSEAFTTGFVNLVLHLCGNTDVSVCKGLDNIPYGASLDPAHPHPNIAPPYGPCRQRRYRSTHIIKWLSTRNETRLIWIKDCCNYIVYTCNFVHVITV